MQWTVSCDILLYILCNIYIYMAWAAVNVAFLNLFARYTYIHYMYMCVCFWIHIYAWSYLYIDAWQAAVRELVGMKQGIDGDTQGMQSRGTVRSVSLHACLPAVCVFIARLHVRTLCRSWFPAWTRAWVRTCVIACAQLFGHSWYCMHAC